MSGTTSRRRRALRRALLGRVAAGFAVMAVSGLVWSSFGLFLVAIGHDLGWSRSAVSGAFTLFALTNALSAPVFGRLMQRHDSRPLLAGTAVLLGVALTGTALVEKVWQYWLVFGVVGGLGAQSVSSFALFSIFARRFRRRLATAMSVADAGSGFAAMAGLVLIQGAVDAWGWRAAYAGIGVFVAVSGGLLHLFVFDAVRQIGEPVAAPNSQPRQAGQIAPVHTLLIASAFCGSAAYHALLTQQIAILTGQGITTELAVWTAAIGGGVVFLWRLVSGWLTDRNGVVQVMVVAAMAVSLAVGSLVALLAVDEIWILIVYATALGVGYGGQQVLVAVTLRRSGATASFPFLLGWVRLASGLGMAAGPITASTLHDATGVSASTILFVAAISFIHMLTYFMYAIMTSPGNGAAVGKRFR